MSTPLVEVDISKDEWWPVYCFTDFPGDYTWKVPIPAEQLARWKAAFDRFQEVQDEIRELVGDYD